MNIVMEFPETVEEFMESYKMTDTEHIYSNGTEYVPIFRMKQWFEHIKTYEGQGMKWIKTSERLPKEGEIVILYDPHADRMCSGILESCYANYRGDLRRVYYWNLPLGLDSLVCSGQYTHWRPLPEPPEVEE